MEGSGDPLEREAGQPPPPRRLGTIDFWRGFVLCTIFINHIPGNPFERFTYRNYGFSDSAEAFVFISGLSLAMAYGNRFSSGRTASAVTSLGRRASRIYGVHLLLSAFGIAIFAAGAAIFVHADLMEPHGRDLVVDDPLAALVGTLSLGHQFGYFNILPLYVLLVAAAPLLLILSRFGLGTMLGASAMLYLVTRLTGLNIPTWPMRGMWFFDPFAWQFLMAIGIACGLGLMRRAWLPRRLLSVVAGIVLVGSAFCATDGFGLRPGLFDAMRAMADLDKTMLGVGRLAHFLCLAYLVWTLHVAEAMQRMPWYGPLCLLGRHGLAVFALLSLLAAVGQVVTQGVGHTVLLDATLVGGGLMVLLGFARLLDARGRRGRTPLRADAAYCGIAERTTL